MMPPTGAKAASQGVLHEQHPDRPALEDGRKCWSSVELSAATAAAGVHLRQTGCHVLATLLDNTPAFVALDQAALATGVVHVPLPLFFTAAQMQHALQAAGVDTLIAAPPLAARWSALPWSPLVLADEAVMHVRLPAAKPTLPSGTAKISFTSGTTGAPKGVCLSADALQQVAGSLVQALAPLAIERHLSALPFAVLLENIAGLMAPRLHGTTVVALPLHEVGLSGSSSFDAARFQAAVQRHRPHSLILLPQMLRAWCGHLLHTGQRAPDSLKLVAVGGAAVGAASIDAAQALGIPACEGYGLSEAASVQTLNLPDVQRAGSAGRVLPHARVRVAADGELEVAGSLFSGYLGDPTPVPEWWPTGDLGRIDDSGFVQVHGRKKNVLITGFGRNVCPEWVETALRSQPAVLQAVVYGDGRPALSAVLWPVQAAVDDAALQSAVDAANATLPDYARVVCWTRGRAAFDVASGLATANGRPQRQAIWQAHATALELDPFPTT
jgi:long-chain acyl-CoA synthetase